MTDLPAAIHGASRLVWRTGEGAPVEGVRQVPAETPVALTYDGSTYAVMMATPADLEDFAYGFSLNESIVTRRDEITELEIIPQCNGIEARMWLAPEASRRQSGRRRQMTGPTGCGLCGVESLDLAVRPLAHVESALTLKPDAILTAMSALAPLQELNAHTRAVHAAAFWQPATGIAAVREDVGRHNALDKLAGHMARENVSCAGGIVLLTSRVSVEMVQKTARMGAPVIAAISAPTALAIRLATEAGITLLAIVRSDGFEIFTHPQRIEEGRAVSAA
jgi:FdhD protein